MRCAEAGEGRHHDDAAGVAAGAAGRGFGVRRRLDEAELVAQPLDGDAGVEDAAFEGVGRAAVDAVADRGEQPRARMAALCAGVGDHEAAAAVGALRHAWLEARLADQRRLLIAGHAADGDGCAEPLRVGGSEVVDAVAHGGQERGRNVEVVEQPWAPCLALDVEKLGARGVGGVRDVAAALGETPDQEAVHGAELEPTGRCVASPLGISKQPFQLRAAEVGVDHEAGDVGDLAFHAVVLDAFAALGGAPVLPDDGGVHRVAGLGVPQHGGLALIGDAERVDACRRDAAAGDCLAASGEGGFPQRLRILLDPAVVREALIERPVRTRHRPPVGVEDDGAGTRRALVDGEHMAHGWRSSCLWTPRT